MVYRNAFALLAGLVLAVGFLTPASARADGDPASDYLVSVDIFTPIDPPPSRALRTDLDNLVFAAKRRGYVIKVAVIGSRTDLGSVPQLFGHPRTYARFLGSEIRFVYTGRLLVVMPQGFGTREVPKSEAQALNGVTIDATSGDGLIRAGMAAVRVSAAAAGLTLPAIKPTPATPAATAPTTSSPPPRAGDEASSLPVLPVAAGIAGVILTAGVALLAWRRPRRPGQSV